MVEDFVSACYRTIEIMLGGVIALVPLAVFGVVAKTIGQEGFRPLLGLGAYVGVAMLGLGIQVFIVYQAWLVLAARMSLRRFWSGPATRWSTPWGRAAASRRCPSRCVALKE